MNKSVIGYATGVPNQAFSQAQIKTTEQGLKFAFILLSLSALLDVVNNITTRYLLQLTTECVLECLANNNHVLAINQEHSQQKANEWRLKVANMTLLKRGGLKSQWGYLAKKQ